MYICITTNEATIDSSVEISKKIKEKRKERGLTQVELAKIAGVSRRYVQKIESGESTTSFIKIIEALKIDLK